MTSTTARALYDNIADAPDELAFRKGDLLVVVDENPAGLEGQGWWLCSLRSKEGLCPANRLKVLPVGVYQGKPSPSSNSISSLASGRAWNSSGGSSSSETSSSSSQYRPQRSMADVYGNVKSRKVVKPVRMGDSFVYLTNDSKDFGGSSQGSHGGAGGTDQLDYDVPRNRPVVDHGGDNIPCYDVPKPKSDLYDLPRPLGGKHSDRSSGVSLLSSSSGSSLLSNISSDSLSLSSVYPSSVASYDPSETYDVPRPAELTLLARPKAGVKWDNRSLDESGGKALRGHRSAKSVDLNTSSDSLDMYDVPSSRFTNSPRPPLPAPDTTQTKSDGIRQLDSILSTLRDFQLDHLKLPPKNSTLSRSGPVPPPKILAQQEELDYDTPLPSVNRLLNKLNAPFHNHREVIMQGNHLPLPPKLGRARPVSTESDLMQDYSIPQPRPQVFRQNSRSESDLAEKCPAHIYGKIVRRDCASELNQGVVKFEEQRTKSISALSQVLSLNLGSPFVESSVIAFAEAARQSTTALEMFLEQSLIYLKTCKKIDAILYSRFDALLKPLINGRKILRDILGIFESFPLSTLELSSCQKRLSVSYEQLVVCATNLISDIKAYSVCFHDNAKKLFGFSPEEWIDDYDYVKLDTRQTGVAENDTVIGSLPADLQTTFFKMVRDSTSSVPANPPLTTDIGLIEFYKPHLQNQLKILANTIDVFIGVVESKLQPSVFINFAKFIIITAFKLVCIGDSVARHSQKPNITKIVSEQSEQMCGVVRSCVEAINRGVRDFPAIDAVQDMFDAVVKVSQQGSELNAAILKSVS